MNTPTTKTRSFLHPCDEIMRTMERIYRHRITARTKGKKTGCQQEQAA